MSTADCEVKSGDNQLASIEDTFVLKVKGTKWTSKVAWSTKGNVSVGVK